MPDANATDRDEPRQATDRDYTLPIEDVAESYHAAGHPRTLRTLQRYCASGHLDCQKVQTALGDKYFVAPYSVARHIAQINEIIAFSPVAAGRDSSRQAATDVAPQHGGFPSPDHATDGDRERQGTTDVASKARDAFAEPPRDSNDRPRQAATEPEPVSLPVVPARVSPDAQEAIDAATAHTIERLEDENEFLREQINRKDKTIDSLIERDRETNILVRGLQEMLTPLLGPRRNRYRDSEEGQRAD